MLNHEGSHHEHFEELGAIAASGQISEAEFIELQDHLQQCADCRSVYADFTDLLHDKLPLAHPDVVGASKLPGFFLETSSYRERFLARARMEGVPIALDAPRSTVRNRLSSWFLLKPLPIAVAVLLTAVCLLSYALYESSLRYYGMVSERTELRGRLAERRQPASAPVRETVSETKPAPASTPDRKNEDELARTRAENEAAEARAQSLYEQLTQVKAEIADLRGEVDHTNTSREDLEKRLKDAEQAANAVREELQGVRQARSRDASTINRQALEIGRVSDRLAEQTELLAQQRELLEASRDVRDLMGSRNFHIADVYEVDSKGKDQQAFGRIFYTENKRTLIIYAFDLNDPNTARRNASFQGWGKRGSQTIAYSLGLFKIDDQKLNRWVLRVEDPELLAHIDSVFVTVEPTGGSARPTGRQFLSAYLDTKQSR